MSADTIPVNSTITLEDSELDAEMVDLSSSCDTSEVICLDDSTRNSSRNTGNLSPDDVDADNNVTTHSSGDVRIARSNDAISQPAFKVMFRDESVSRKYRQQIKKFLHTLLQSKPSHEEDENASDLILEVWDNENNSKNELFVSPESNSISNDDIHGNDACNLLFTIDNQPNVTDSLDVPKYGQKYKGTFETSNSETSKSLAPKLNCFNCNGNHNMRDCTLPKNHANINKNRKEFAAKQNAGMRYHLSEEQKFSHMTPGQLSSKLRKALGLKDNQLPRHIYRMRLLGYPPGWLEEARLQHSGISLFNSDGKAEVDFNEEEEEIFANIDKDQYDVKKIHDFPGFNVLPPTHTIDDSHKHRVPQMQHMHSKEMMLCFLQNKKTDDGYKRKKLKLPAPVNTLNISKTSGDMEIENTAETESVVENVPINGHFIPPLPKEATQMPPTPPPSLESLQSVSTEDSNLQSQEFQSSDSTSETQVTRNSPSLSDLENRKKQLLLELEDTSSQSNSGSTSLKIDPNATFVSDMTSFSDLVSTSQSNSPSQKSLDTSQEDSMKTSDASFKNDLNASSSTIAVTSQSNSTPITTPQKSPNTNQASIKPVRLGTPILPSASPYNKLPSSEKFSENICDVINFENLPDSTGKYEQMTGVLHKVRNVMAKLHQE